ncbi:MAG: TonB family protein [Porticoccaceae bacterium]|jgi:colicin import membrane protein
MIGWRSGYITAVLSSIGLHVLVVAAFLIDWPSENKDIVVQPQFIQAELIQLKPKEKPKKKASNSKAKDLAAKRREAERQRAEQQRREKQRIAAREAERLEKLRQQEQARQKREQKQRELAQERARKQAALDEKLRQEQAAELAQQDKQSANSYLQLIQGRLSQNWSRPPSARLGMQTLIELRLVPTGRIVGVKILQSSGDIAFDRSVEQAAFKAAPFSELQSMEPRLFEQYFRVVKVLFNPEDLRL